MVEMADFTCKFSITLNFPNFCILHITALNIICVIVYILLFPTTSFSCVFFLSWAKTEMTLNYSNFLTKLYTNLLFSGVMVLALVVCLGNWCYTAVWMLASLLHTAMTMAACNSAQT